MNVKKIVYYRQCLIKQAILQAALVGTNLAFQARTGAGRGKKKKEKGKKEKENEEKKEGGKKTERERDKEKEKKRIWPGLFNMI